MELSCGMSEHFILLIIKFSNNRFNRFATITYTSDTVIKVDNFEREKLYTSIDEEITSVPNMDKINL